MVRPSVFQDVSLPSLPAVVVFKDGSYVTFDGEGVSWLLTPAGRLQEAGFSAQVCFRATGRRAEGVDQPRAFPRLLQGGQLLSVRHGRVG